MPEREFIDYYDFLMISPKADAAMVEAAVECMKQRHSTGRKRKLADQAGEVLADPKGRLHYDQERSQRQLAAKDDKYGISSKEVELHEKNRRAVLVVLYRKLVSNPRDPGIGNNELARRLGYSLADLQFAFWVLRESDLIKSTQDGILSITVAGVRWLEERRRESGHGAEATQDSDGLQHESAAPPAGGSSAKQRTSYEDGKAKKKALQALDILMAQTDSQGVLEVEPPAPSPLSRRASESIDSLKAWVNSPSSAIAPKSVVNKTAENGTGVNGTAVKLNGKPARLDASKFKIRDWDDASVKNSPSGNVPGISKRRKVLLVDRH